LWVAPQFAKDPAALERLAEAQQLLCARAVSEEERPMMTVLISFNVIQLYNGFIWKHLEASESSGQLPAAIDFQKLELQDTQSIAAIAAS